MSDCIFCKIANGEAPCFKIWENDEFMAFLDIMPNVK
jgi:histidine triad (HIT) family protein